MKPDDSDDSQLLEPWFRSRQESEAIKRGQTLIERRKFADFFTMHGCLRCQTKERPHGGEALCAVCHAWFASQLNRVMHLRAKGELE